MPVEMLTYAALGDRTEAAVRVAAFVYPIDWTSPHPPRGRCPRGPYHWGFGEAHHGPHRSNHPEGLRCSHEPVDAIKPWSPCRSKWSILGRRLCFRRHDPIGQRLAFPLGRPRHAAEHPPPHFRHVIISTLRAGPTFL
jgi:hypothetical protein